MKKLIILFLFLAVAVAVAFNIASKKAPEMLRRSIERALDKTVKIQNIEFNFPWNFELTGVEIRDNHGAFSGEVCFAVDKIHLAVSPLSLSQKDLIIDRVDVGDATIIIRKRDNRLYHVLSDAMISQPSSSSGKADGAAPSEKTGLPLDIHQFRLTNGNFQFIDYDVSDAGFVITLDKIQASAKDIHLPSKEEKTTYRVDARMPQGRDQKPGEVKISGWTIFSNYETDALLTAGGLHLPYFEPYLGQVTPAKIEDGYLSSRTSIRVDQKDLTANSDLELNGLYFQSYEEGDQLFGLKADEILTFLKDAAGRLKFQIVVQWNIADKSTEKRAVIRKSIEKSLKKTVLGNVGNLLESTLKKIGDHGIDSGRDDLEGALKKVKELFR